MTELSEIRTETSKDEISYENSNNLRQIGHIWYLFKHGIVLGYDNFGERGVLFFLMLYFFLSIFREITLSVPWIQWASHITERDSTSLEKGGRFLCSFIIWLVFPVIHILTILFVLVLPSVAPSLQSAIRYFLRLK